MCDLSVELHRAGLRVGFVFLFGVVFGVVFVFVLDVRVFFPLWVVKVGCTDSFLLRSIRSDPSCVVVAGLFSLPSRVESESVKQKPSEKDRETKERSERGEKPGTVRSSAVRAGCCTALRVLVRSVP